MINFLRAVEKSVTISRSDSTAYGNEFGSILWYNKLTPGAHN